MKITTLRVKEFSVFKNVTIDFSPGLNVLIGANATGKSHLMKLGYSILKTGENALKDKTTDAQLISAALKEKLVRVFRPDDLQVNRLVRRGVGNKSATIDLNTPGSEFSFKLTTRNNLTIKQNTIKAIKTAIFIPSREVLAMYEGFIDAYTKRELSFDETYYDLCVALSGRPLRGPRLKEAAALLDPLEEILGGKVALNGNRFHVSLPDGLLEAHLLSEGYRKIASLVHLISNGSLMKNGVLFWDEPEANLNPQLVTKIAGILRQLAKSGVQVFIATHDFLLSQELSLAQEYKVKPIVDMRFFAFNRHDDGTVRIETGDSLVDLENNPILEEFAAHYDREQLLFSKKANTAKEG